MITSYVHIGGTVIRIFADSPFADVQDAVSRLPQIRGVEYSIIVNDPLPEIISYCDIVIVKRRQDTSLCEMKKIMRPEARLVLCIEREKEKLDDEDFGYLDDLWLYPFNASRALLRLTNLVSSILREREAELYKNWLDALMNLVPDMVWFKNLEGEHLKVNKAFSRLAGKTRKMVEGKTHVEIWGEDDSVCAASEMEVLNAGEKRAFDEILVIGGTPHHLKTYKAPFRGPGGTIVGTLGVAQDLTSLLNLNMEMGIFLEAMPFPLILTCDNGLIIHVNNRFLEMFDESSEDLIGANYEAWKDWAFEDVSELIGNVLHFTHNEKNLLVQIMETPLKDSFGEFVGMVRAFQDVTAEKELEAQIWKAANLDTLTSLANRHAFSSWVRDNKAAISHIMYLDLDNFKYVNDTFGHEKGDEALRRLADSIRAVFPDDFATRLGGDEFLICVCREMDAAAIKKLAKSLQQNVAKAYNRSSYLKSLSLSIGIRANCEEDIPIEQLIRDADAAMYKVKESEKGQIAFWAPQENLQATLG